MRINHPLIPAMTVILSLLFTLSNTQAEELIVSATSNKHSKVYPAPHAAPATQAARPVSYAAEVEGYQLKPGDIIEISVWKEPDLNKEILISPDGAIAFPLIGQLRAAERTISDLRRELKEKLAPYIPEPSVSVLLRNGSGNKFYVLGKVNRPGEYVMAGPVNVLQALSIAGGTATYANTSHIKVIRKSPQESKAIEFDYTDLEKGKRLNQNIVLRSGDVVLVP